MIMITTSNIQDYVPHIWEQGQMTSFKGQLCGEKWGDQNEKGLIVGRRRKKSTDKLEIYLLLSGPLYQGPHGNHEFGKMFYFRAIVRSFPINNNCVRLFWSENHKVKLRWLFDKNPLCCFTTNYQSQDLRQKFQSRKYQSVSVNQEVQKKKKGLER